MKLSTITSKQRFIALDGLRGLAIALVVLFHCTHVFFRRWEGSSLAFSLAHTTWFGVDLFFALSGFLITGILVDRRGSSDYFRRFYWRRTWRIFPAYYAYVLLLIAYVFIRGSRATEEVKELTPWMLTYTQNLHFAWSGYPKFKALVHLWSLAVEEQFYFLWPAVVAFAPPRHLGKICVALAFTAIGLRAGLAAMGASWITAYVTMFTRLDSLMVGAGLAIMMRSETMIGVAAKLAKPAMLIGTAGLAALFVHAGGRFDQGDPLFMTGGYALLALVAGGLLFTACTVETNHPLRRVLESRPLTYLGTISYGLYLIHYAVIPLLEPRMAAYQGPSAGWVALGYSVFAVVVSVIGAALSWHLFESRVLRWKDRAFTTPSAAADTP